MNMLQYNKIYFVLFLMLLLFLKITSINAFDINLKSNSNQADYLIITTSKFINSLIPLINYRTNQKLKILVINIQDIYIEFQKDSSRAEAIRNFISYSLEYWADPKPRYLLLVGDTEIIPSYRLLLPLSAPNYSKEDSVSIDDWFAINKYDDDLIPDIAIGRFPVINCSQLEILINKTIKYDSLSSINKYAYDFLFLADSMKGNPFEHILDNFINLYINGNYNYKRIDIRYDSPYFGATEDIFKILNKGTIFFSYYGHGNPEVWSNYDYFRTEFIDKYLNCNKPFLLTTMACNQNFDIFGKLSIIEKFLLYPTGGAVATFASSGYSHADYGNAILNKLYEKLLVNKNLNLGDAILSTKKELLQPGIKLDNYYLRFTLLGDPSLKIPINITYDIVVNQHSVPKDFILYQNYPNPFNSSTVISFELSKSGKVELVVYNIVGQKVQTLISKNLKAGKYSVNLKANEFKSGIYLINLNYNNISKSISMILIK